MKTDLPAWEPWPQPEKVTLPVASTWLTAEEETTVTDAIASNWVGPNGAYSSQSEELLSKYLGQPTLLTTNGTIALLLAIQALGLEPGDEVVVPSTTYAATANAVIAAGGRPVFCDIEPYRWGLDKSLLDEAISERTRGIIAVHLYGVACDIEGIYRFCRDKGLWLIEDCAESFLATRNGRVVGTWGDAATFSFFANKLITCGEGGAVSTPRHDVLESMKAIRGQGMSPTRRYYFDRFGMNYRLSNLSAAVLSAQLKRLTDIWMQRESTENAYDDLLGGLVQRQTIAATDSRSPWIYTCTLPEDGPESNTVGQALAKEGIETRPIFYPLPSMPAFFGYRATPFARGIQLARRGISLPTGIHVTTSDIRKVASIITSFYC